VFSQDVLVTKTLAIVAFILTFLFPPAGLILGIVALVKIKQGQAEGRGLAFAAVMISPITLILQTVLWSFVYLVANGFQG